MNYHIDDWRANNAPKVTADNLLGRCDTDDDAYPTAMAAWTAPRNKYTAAYDCIREYPPSCFPPSTTADKRWHDAGQPTEFVVTERF